MAPKNQQEQLIDPSKWADLFGELKTTYLATTTRKLKLIDMFIAFSVTLALIQAIYAVICSRHPYNTFIAATFCSLGHAILCLCLRLQVANPKDFGGLTAESALSGYLIGCLVLFLFGSTLMEKFN